MDRSEFGAMVKKLQWSRYQVAWGWSYETDVGRERGWRSGI
jgi:hypothetical protein